MSEKLNAVNLAKEEITILKHIIFGNPKNCELAERDMRYERQVILAYAILNLPEIVRFIIHQVLPNLIINL